MDWVTVAILGTVAIGLVNIIDSHLVSQRMPGLRTFLLAAGLFILIPSLFLALLFPLPHGVDGWPLVVTLVSGAIRTFSIIILLYIYKTEDVSQAIPVFHIFPVFVALLAVPILGEVLGGWQWLAILVIVAGAVIISVRWVPGGTTIWMGRPFWLLLAAGLLIAVADVGSKYALDYISFWNMYWLTSLCMVAILLAISLRSRVFRQLRDMPRRYSTLMMIAVNETVAVIGIILIFWAMEQGPVSLVSTITGSRPLLVLLLVFVLNHLIPGFLLKGKPAGRTQWQRLIATSMIAGGIAIIYLA